MTQEALPRLSETEKPRNSLAWRIGERVIGLLELPVGLGLTALGTYGALKLLESTGNNSSLALPDFIMVTPWGIMATLQSGLLLFHRHGTRDECMLPMTNPESQINIASIEPSI